MAMQYIDVTGATDAEAIAKALSELGLERDDVSVEILERAKKGIFGIGASPAKVRVTYEVPDAPPAPPVEPPKKACPVEKAPQQEKQEKQQDKQERPPRREKRRQQPRQERPVQETAEGTEKSPEKAEKAPEKPLELGEEVFDEKSQQIRAFLDGLMAHMDSDAKAKVYQPEKGRYKVILEGSRMGALIGRRGETLDAIQQLTNYSMNRGSDRQRVRVQVDAEGYREKREESLQRLAAKTAAKVIKYRRNVTLEPMNAYERHVIHTALQDTEGVTTFSTGTDPNRRVVVAYDRDRH